LNGSLAGRGTGGKEDDMGRFDALTARRCPPERTRAVDLGILALRLGAGGLLAGHGAQKLFGAFGGAGLAGTAGWLESLGLRQGKAWATLAGLAELGGGSLMALGLGGPLGPIALQGAMATATRRVHWGKPIWNTEGGAELPMLFSLTGLAIAITGPGRYSLDRAFSIRVPDAVAALAGAGVVAGIALGELRSRQEAAVQARAETTTAEAQAEDDRLIESRPASERTERERAAPEQAGIGGEAEGVEESTTAAEGDTA
jgi:putative oxidoreductase